MSSAEIPIFIKLEVSPTATKAALENERVSKSTLARDIAIELQQLRVPNSVLSEIGTSNYAHKNSQKLYILPV